MPMILNARAERNLYSNCRMLSNSGTLMCFCARKRADWYVERDLAVVVSDDPYTIQLTFQPNGLGRHDQPFYLQVIPNRCVVCGFEENLNTHHVIPRCFRRHFPTEYKSHASHDVLLLCVPCHQDYELKAMAYKNKMIGEYETQRGNRCSDRQREHSKKEKPYRIARALKYHSHCMPDTHKARLWEQLNEIIGHKVNEDDLDRFEPGRESMPGPDWEGFAKSIADINVFIREWRQHFIDTMEPMFLPDHWDIQHVETLNGE